MQQCFHPTAKHLFYKYTTPSFVGHSFRVKDETWYFFANSPLRILISSQIYFRVVMQVQYRTHRMKLLTWCRVVSQAGLFGSGRARA